MDSADVGSLQHQKTWAASSPSSQVNQSYKVQNSCTHRSSPASSYRYLLGFSPLPNQGQQLPQLPQYRDPQLHAQSIVWYTPTTQVSASLRPQAARFFNPLETTYPSSGRFSPSQLPSQHQYYAIPHYTPSLEHQIRKLLMPYQSSPRLTWPTRVPHSWDLVRPNYSHISKLLPSSSSIAAPRPYSTSQTQKILQLLYRQEKTPAQAYFPNSQIRHRSALFNNSAPPLDGDPNMVWALHVPQNSNQGPLTRQAQLSQLLNGNTSSSKRRRSRPDESNNNKAKKGRGRRVRL